MSTVIASASETGIAADSRLAIARPDRDAKLLRLFYQGSSGDGGGVNKPLCEIRYDEEDKIWSPQGNSIIDDAMSGTRLKAVSDKTTQAVRLYYQGNDSQLREMYCDSDYIWKPNCKSSLSHRLSTYPDI